MGKGKGQNLLGQNSLKLKNDRTKSPKCYKSQTIFKDKIPIGQNPREQNPLNF